MTLGEKIKSVRKEKGWSQEKLGQMINIAKSVVWKYEKDEAVPSAEVIKRVAQAFSVSTDYLLFDKTEKENITKINDKKLLLQFEEVDKMSPEDREYIMKTIDLVINKNKIKKMVS